MRNDKRACIFEHEGFVYVCNFEAMTVWIITEEDEANPTTALEYSRHAPGVWAYRFEGSDGPYQIDNDMALGAKIDLHYEQYLNRIIVGKDGRTSSQNLAEAVQVSRLPTARKPDKSVTLHTRKN